MEIQRCYLLASHDFLIRRIVQVKGVGKTHAQIVISLTEAVACDRVLLPDHCDCRVKPALTLPTTMVDSVFKNDQPKDRDVPTGEAIGKNE